MEKPNLDDLVLREIRTVTGSDELYNRLAFYGKSKLYTWVIKRFCDRADIPNITDTFMTIAAKVKFELSYSQVKNIYYKPYRSRYNKLRNTEAYINMRKTILEHYPFELFWNDFFPIGHRVAMRLAVELELYNRTGYATETYILVDKFNLSNAVICEIRNDFNKRFLGSDGYLHGVNGC